MVEQRGAKGAASNAAVQPTTLLVIFTLLLSSSTISTISSANQTGSTASSAPVASQPTNLKPTATDLSQARHTNSPERSWIESILVHVEDETLKQEHHRTASIRRDDELAEQESAHIASLRTSSGQPQVPTDSAEDPLEATTLSSGLQMLVPARSTAQPTRPTAPQYALATDDDDDNHSSQQQVSSSSSPSSLDDEQRLVDSNNVSAILGASNGLGQAQLERQAQGVTSATISTTPRQIIGCEQAYTQCALRKACAPALKSYNDDCQELISNRTSQCSAKCLRAMIALRSTEEGDDLVNCDCQGNEYCAQSKERSQSCRPQVDWAVDPQSVVSCSTASWICLADHLCSTALDFYYRNCQSLFSQRHCSMRCNNSLSILYRQPKASKLISCQCDGSEEFPCLKYKTYTERLCLNKAASSANLLQLPQANTNYPLGSQSSDTDADDGYNMTNDPETFVLASQESGEYATNEDANEEDADDQRDDQRAADSADPHEESDQADGIQPLEDNWIPLISGRYFTNLQQQQQQQQQPHQAPQRAKLNQRRQQVAAGQAHHHQRPQKSTKAKSARVSGYPDASRRYSRMFPFVSSSGASVALVQPIFLLFSSSLTMLLLLLL